MLPTLLADYACDTGEGPLWHPEEKALYWTDIPRGKIYRLDWKTKKHGIAYEGEPVGGMTLQADGSLALFKAKGAVETMAGAKRKTLIPGLPNEAGSRFNDVIADPAGRVFAGTMSCKEHAGTLYRIDPDLTVTPVLEDVGCSNGMGFNFDRDRMYHIDSTARLVSLFDYDEASGAISNRRDFLREPPVPGVPDGMTVDADDHLWIAYWDGSCVVRYDPNGREVQRFPLPAKKVSCVLFGGPESRDLFVTTAGGQDKDANGHDAGALFHLVPGVGGRPEFRSKLGL